MDYLIIAVTWFGQEHRFLGLDWSWLDLLGMVGQLIFSFRFISQWIESEKRGISYIPVSFWYWSIAGSLVLTIYWIFKRSPVGILANLPNTLIYFRNLQLIKRHKQAATAAAPTQTPVEEMPPITESGEKSGKFPADEGPS
ncbi:MAG: lipid-A-disaccharide synthase N-terminal domain-containing protein [Verrucomicrobiota bacterium]